MRSDDHEIDGRGNDGVSAHAPAETDAPPGSGHELGWSPAERALLDSALDFFGAAQGVIDYGGSDRPRLRCDVDGLQGVRSTMAALEKRIHVAHEAGMTPERIASITRLEQEIVELIITRHARPASDSTSEAKTEAELESPEPS